MCSEACDLAKSCRRFREEGQRLQARDTSPSSQSSSSATAWCSPMTSETNGGSSSGAAALHELDASSEPSVAAAVVTPGPGEPRNHRGGLPSAEPKGQRRAPRKEAKRNALTHPTSSVNPNVWFTDELTVYEAHGLAERFNLPAGQVTQAWKVFKRYDSSDTGVLSSIDFQCLLRAVLRDRFPKAKDIPRELFKRASDKGDAVTFTDLLVWITENSFSEYMLLSEEQRFVREIARKFHTSIPEVEAVKRHFDKFDNDGSGCIEYTEFTQLLHLLLGVKDQSNLPESRVQAFWRELDEDCSGIVEFKEFIPWYMGYFHNTAEISPIEAYYRNIRPVPFPYHRPSGS